MKKIIARLLIVIGLCIVGGSLYTNYKVEKANNDIVEAYENLIENSINGDKSIKKDKNKKSYSDKLPENIIGVLKIPKIDLKVVVQEGTDMETLKYAVGHFKETSMPGEAGNFAVAGHRAYTYNKFFSNLDKIQTGDSIEILNNDGLHTYEVTSSEVVEPDQVEVLKSDLDEKSITLITCTPKFVGSHRLVIKGKLI
ncbi:class D sortase [Faecalimicrobium sp. JNUCC 81]